MAPAAGGAQMPAPGPTNVVILTKIPDGITEQQIASSAGRYSEVLQVSYRPADLEGPGWAIVAFATPDLAKAARERFDGKPVPGTTAGPPVEAALGEGLFGNVRTITEQDSPWKEARTPQGQVYYYHAVTRQSLWTKPPPEFPTAMPGMSHLGGRPGYGSTAYGYNATVSGGSLGSANPGVQAVIQAAQAAAAASQATAGAGNDSSAASGANAPGPIGANLFVYHIPNSWDDGILRQHFEHFGRIVSCRVQKDPDGRPRGFGFVSYDAPAAAQAAIAGMHGFPVEGKWLKVQLKKGDEQQLDKAQPLLSGNMSGLLDLSGANQATAPAPGLPPGLQPMPRPFSSGSQSLSSGGIAMPPLRPGLAPQSRPGPY